MSRQLALQLDSRRREIDEELEAMMSVLRSHNSTLTSPLVDEEGFPRADIDIHAVRIARNRIAMLRNDRVDITNQMAEAMRQAFLEPPNGISSTALPNGSGSADDSASSSSEAPSTSFKPFAQINSVTPGSPADQAGLRQGDLVLSFAGLATSEADDASPAPSLSDLPPLVVESRQIEVIVKSGAETRVLQLTPSSGAGHRGLLGCHLLPL